MKNKGVTSENIHYKNIHYNVWLQRQEVSFGEVKGCVCVSDSGGVGGWGMRLAIVMKTDDEPALL